MTRNHTFSNAETRLIDGKYRIERFLGSGSMGEVYEAIQVSIGRRVAVKLLQRHFAHDRNIVERFHREARAAASIGQDNICEVTDFGFAEDGAPYLVMPLLKGSSFHDLLDNECLRVGRVIDIVCQTLQALQAAHLAGIVHRDLKPANVFVTQIGDRSDFVKLLDFGISKFTHMGDDLHLTIPGEVVGTPFYMSPEQATGSRSIDHRTDLYSVGVMLYEAITGRLPYDGESHNEVLHKIATMPFTAPRVINPDIPKPLERVILTALERDPGHRYDSAESMRRALEQATALDSGAARLMAPRRQSAESIVRSTGEETRPVRSGFRQLAFRILSLIPFFGPTLAGRASAGAFRDGPPGVGHLPTLRDSDIALETGATLKEAKGHFRAPWLAMGVLVLSIVALLMYVVLGDRETAPVAPAQQGPRDEGVAHERLPSATPDAPLVTTAEAPEQMSEAKSSGVELPAPIEPQSSAGTLGSRKQKSSVSKKRKARGGGRKRHVRDRGRPRPPVAATPDKETTTGGSEVVKGRFRTVIVSDYE